MLATKELLQRLCGRGWKIVPLVRAEGSVEGFLAVHPTADYAICHICGYEVRDGMEIGWSTFGGSVRSAELVAAKRHLTPAWERPWRNDMVPRVVPFRDQSRD